MTREHKDHEQAHDPTVADELEEAEHSPEIARRTSLSILKQEAEKDALPPDVLATKRDGSPTAAPAKSHDQIRDEARASMLAAFLKEVRWTADRMLVATANVRIATSTDKKDEVTKTRQEVYDALGRLRSAAKVLNITEREVLDEIAVLREGYDKLGPVLSTAAGYFRDATMTPGDLHKEMTLILTDVGLSPELLVRDAINPDASTERTHGDAALTALLVAADKDVAALASALATGKNPEITLGWLEVALHDAQKLLEKEPARKRAHVSTIARIAKAFDAIHLKLADRFRDSPGRLLPVTGMLQGLKSR